MTRDEHRAQCIEALKAAIWNTKHGYDGGLAQAIAALSSLDGIAFIDPIEATDEMLEAGQRFLPIEGISNGYLRNIYAAMCSAGNPHNPPEKKP